LKEKAVPAKRFSQEMLVVGLGYIMESVPQLERELAEAREIVEMQKETMRQMREQYGIGERNVMRELRQQRDALAKGFDAAQQAIVEAVKQRDTLAEALIIIAYRIHSVDYCGEIAEKALAAVKGDES
jgi:hypothetical protein